MWIIVLEMLIFVLNILLMYPISCSYYKIFVEVHLFHPLRESGKLNVVEMYIMSNYFLFGWVCNFLNINPCPVYSTIYQLVQCIHWLVLSIPRFDLKWWHSLERELLSCCHEHIANALVFDQTGVQGLLF